MNLPKAAQKNPIQLGRSERKPEAYGFGTLKG